MTPTLTFRGVPYVHATRYGVYDGWRYLGFVERESRRGLWVAYREPYGTPGPACRLRRDAAEHLVVAGGSVGSEQPKED